MVRPEDNFKYYAYMLLYVDACLVIHHDVEMTLTELDHYFAMKKGSIRDPDIYLGAKLRAVELNNGVKACVEHEPSQVCQGSGRKCQGIP